MKLYLISQRVNQNYDTYDSAVVCAEDEEDAKTIHPNGSVFEKADMYADWGYKKDDITVEEIGVPFNQERGVVLASFNAG